MLLLKTELFSSSEV